MAFTLGNIRMKSRRYHFRVVAFFGVVCLLAIMFAVGSLLDSDRSDNNHSYLFLSIAIVSFVLRAYYARRANEEQR